MSDETTKLLANAVVLLAVESEKHELGFENVDRNFELYKKVLYKLLDDIEENHCRINRLEQVVKEVTGAGR